MMEDLYRNNYANDCDTDHTTLSLVCWVAGWYHKERRKHTNACVFRLDSVQSSRVFAHSLRDPAMQPNHTPTPRVTQCGLLESISLEYFDRDLW